MKKKKRSQPAKHKSTQKPGERPRLVLLVGCDYVTGDPNSGKTTLYGLYDNLIPASLKGGVSIRVYAKFLGGSGKHKISFAMTDASGKVIQNEGAAEVDVTCRKRSGLQIVVLLANVPIKKHGKYELIALCDGEPYEHSYPVTIKTAGNKSK